jgi:hypothetical protein
MGISFPNAHMRRKKKIMRRKRSLIKATRKTRNSQRRSILDKLMLIKIGTQVMRVPSWKVMTWQPSPSRAKLHQASHSFQTSRLMAKESKKKIKSKASSSPKYITSDEDTLLSDNYISSDDDDSLPSELVKNPNATIKCLMKKVGARDELLE